MCTIYTPIFEKIHTTPQKHDFRYRGDIEIGTGIEIRTRRKMIPHLGISVSTILSLA